MVKVLVILLFFANHLDFIYGGDGCVIDMLQLPVNEPLFLERHGNTGFVFKIPIKGNIVALDNEKFWVSCANSQGGDENSWIFEVQCRKKNLYRISNGNVINLQTFGCPLKNQPILRGVSDTSFCPLNTRRYEIGFQIPSIFGAYVSFIDLCHDYDKATTILTSHWLYGTSINDRMTSTSSTFRSEGIDPAVRLDNCYKKTAQEIIFSNRYIKPTGEKFFAKGHLTPDSDGISKSWRDSTYFYMNTIPQWQKINNGIWKRIENAVRLFAEDFNNNIKDLTGTFESQTLNNVNHFCGNKVEIPKWIYKILLRPRIGTTDWDGVAFVTLNDIYATTPPAPLPCPDMCDTLGWLPSKRDFDRKRLDSGYTICCSIHDLKATVTTLPIDPTNMKTVKADGTTV